MVAGSYFLSPARDDISNINVYEMFNEAFNFVTFLILSFAHKWVYIIKHCKKGVGATNRTEHKAIIQVWLYCSNFQVPSNFLSAFITQRTYANRGLNMYVDMMWWIHEIHVFE